MNSYFDKQKSEVLLGLTKQLEEVSLLLVKAQKALPKLDSLLKKINSDLESKGTSITERYKLKALKERVIIKKEKNLLVLKENKNKYTILYRDVIIQREALGLFDHSFLKEHYGEIISYKYSE